MEPGQPCWLPWKLEAGAPRSTSGCIPIPSVDTLPPHLHRAVTLGTCGRKGATEPLVLLTPWKVASHN